MTSVTTFKNAGPRGLAPGTPLRALSPKRAIRALSLFLITFTLLGTAATAATFTVTNTSDAGAGSLRQAIIDANATLGADVISFAIPAAGVQTISVLSGYPVITEQVFIDGWSQPSWGGTTPVIEINGAATNTTFGLNLQANNCVVRGLAINNFPAQAGNGVGIGLFNNISGNWIYGCHIGVDASGMTARPNGQIGIWIGAGPTGTLIGTNGDGVNDALERNVISANVFGHGILLMSNSNTVAGNYIGLAADGTTAMGNTSAGIMILNGSNNTIGGTIAARRNIISGNGTHGVLITGATSTGNTVLGNYIGTDAGGTLDRGNTLDGVIISNASSNTIGGTAAGARNVISGNNRNGVNIELSATGNTVAGNYIGSNAAGSTNISNNASGVLISSNSNTVGGTAAGARNVISGFGNHGVLITGGAQSNLVQGNYIGTDATGAIGLGLGNSSGVLLDAPNNTVGGTTPGAGNVVARCFQGIYVAGTASGSTIQGNYVGTNATGTAALGNGDYGIVSVLSSGNMIGGATPGARNLASGNGSFGIGIFGGNANSVLGNYVGTDATGTVAIPNPIGVQVTSGSSNTVIGGTAVGAGNLISGNTTRGISITGTTTTSTLIQGNLIGTNAAGTGDLGNGTTGILIDNNSGHTIGGAAAGARNVISGNDENGITISSPVAGGPSIAATPSGSGIPSSSLAASRLSDLLISASPLSGLSGQNLRSTLSERAILRPAVIDGEGAGRTTVKREKGKGGSPSILTASGMVIQGNYIGTDITGTVSLGNSIDGILIDNATNNLVGGTAVGTGNLISGNGISGIHISGATSTANTVQGNYIGTNSSGTGALPNVLDGMRLDISASSNTIGGTAAGAGNVISGNNQVGLRMQPGCTGNIVQGNRIGTSAAGTAAVPNTWGVYLYQAPSNTFGGTVAGAGNLISGNALDGLTFLESNNNIAQGNRIGTDITGTIDLGNGRDGFLVESSSNSIIGGTTSPARNLISGNNRQGLLIRQGVGATNNLVQGNYVGTSANGTAAIGNSGDGINIEGSAANIIGGTVAGAGNLISGNAADGIRILNATATNNVVQGNIIGLDAAGTTALGNGAAGVAYHSSVSSNILGGSAPGSRNVISGNLREGVYADATTSASSIQGNYIGTDITGTLDRGNNFQGVAILGSNWTIGGSGAGQGNVISGNNQDGINFFTAAATGGIVRGNIIGLDASGAAALGNSLSGVAFVSGSTGGRVGGMTATERNIISGNSVYGVYTDATTSDIWIAGSYIGTDITGTLDRGNGSSGVFLNGTNNRVESIPGGTMNVISGNNFDGIILDGAGATGNFIRGNIIGLDASGTTAIGNSFAGIGLHNGASNHTIGGTAVAERNIISGNGREGVWADPSVSGLTVVGNYIGTDISGTLARGNAFAGVELRGTNGTVGGSTAGARNVISANATVSGTAGVYMNGAGASGNLVTGNYIGTNAAGTGALGNNGEGVRINAGSNNRIGGTTAGLRNIIANNVSDGVGALLGTGNAVLGNSIFNNGAEGIDLADDGITANDVGDPDAGVNNLQNYPVVSALSLLPGGDISITYSVNSTAANSAYPVRIEIFASDGAREGKTLQAVDSYTLPSSSRTFTFTPPAPVNAGDRLVLTATDANGNSSEFSAEAGVAPTITVDPASLARCQGQSASFTVTATGTNLSYQWQKNGVNIPSAQSQTYTIASVQPVDAGNYRVIVGSATNPAAFTDTSSAATLTVNTLPVIVTQPANVGVCQGQPAFIAVIANGTGLTYQWRKNGVNIPGATLGSYYIPTASASDVASYDVVISGTCAPSVTSASATLTLLSAPSITGQPAPQTTCQGQTVSFAVTATGSSLTYQWRFNGVNIGGQVGSTLQLANVQPSQAGTYDVIVSGSCSPGVTSSGAALVVNASPAITAQPVPSTTCQGVPVTFSVAATGAGLTYQWRKNGVDIAAATSSTYTIASPQPADAGFYSVLVSGTCAPPLPSNTAQLIVNTAPVISVQPTPVTICQNGQSSFTVTATGTEPFSYQWRKNGVNIPGGTARTYVIPSTQPADAGSYSVVVSGVCAPGATSASVALVVNTAPVISLQPANVTTCQNSPASFTVTATGTGPFTYQWRKTGVPITGATAQTYTIASVQPDDAGQYDVVVGGTCAPAATSAIATLVVNTPPAITSMTPSSAACINTPFTFNVTATGTGPLTYQWRKNGINIPGAIATTYTIASVQLADAADYTVAVTGLCAPPAISSVATLTVNTPPAITAQPQALLTVCENQPATFSIGATGAGLTYQWRKNGVPIAGATASSYTINPTTPLDAGIYSVVVGGGCLPTPVTSSNAQLVVNSLPRISASPLSQTICRTKPVTFSVVATGTNITYQWRRNGVAIPGATGTSYSIASAQPAGAGSYDVVVSGTCSPSVTSAVATLTVTIEPTLFKWTESQTKAAGSPMTFSIIATGSNLSYQWWKGNTPIPGATGTSYTIPSVQTSDAGLYSVVVSNGCANETSGGIFLFVGDGTSLAAMPGDQTVCTGSTARFVAPGDDQTFTYMWKRNGELLAGANTSTLQIPNAGSADEALYTVTVIDRETGMMLELHPAQLTVVTGTEITASPSSATYCQGDRVRLEVAARGAGLRYQWRKDGIEIPAATEATYEPGAAADRVVGRYDVVITGDCGAAVTSEIAYVDVDQPARITRSLADTVIPADARLELSIEAVGTGLEFQWRRNGIAIDGATDPTLVIDRVLPRDSGSYDVVVRGECGQATTSRTMHLGVEGVSVVTGMPEIATGAMLRTMPHPAYGMTRLELTLPESVHPGAATRLVLVDLFGREAVDLSASYSANGYRTAEFDADALASGLYSVRIETTSYSGVVGTVVVRK